MTRRPRLHIQSGPECRKRIPFSGRMRGYWIVITYPTLCGRTVLDEGISPLPEDATCRVCARVYAKTPQPPTE